jgi:hypothetical protein
MKRSVVTHPSPAWCRNHRATSRCTAGRVLRRDCGRGGTRVARAPLPRLTLPLPLFQPAQQAGGPHLGHGMPLTPRPQAALVLVPAQRPRGRLVKLCARMLPLGQAGQRVRMIPIVGSGHHAAMRPCPRPRLSEAQQRYLRCGPQRDLLRHARRLPPLRVVRPRLRPRPPHGHRPGGLGLTVAAGHGNLAVAHLAQGPRILSLHPFQHNEVLIPKIRGLYDINSVDVRIPRLHHRGYSTHARRFSP